MQDPFPTQDPFSSFDAVFTVVPIVIVGVFVLIVVLAVRRAVKFKKAGLDPIDPAADIAVRALQPGGILNPGAAAPVQRTLTDRLAELDALAQAGTITAAERDAARAKLLGSL